MQQNVGKLERIIRLVAGLGIFSLFYFLDGDARWWGLVGVIPLTTGMLGWCLPYALFGIDTRSLSGSPS